LAAPKVSAEINYGVGNSLENGNKFGIEYHDHHKPILFKKFL